MDINKELGMYSDMLYRYLLGLCKDPDTAEELTQETFYQALRSAGKYDGSCKISTWLCQIGKHMWFNELRKRKRNPETAVDETIAFAVTYEKGPEEQFLQKERYIQMLGNIHKLSEDSKEVVLLRLAADISFREIALIMGKSESWARVTYFRARQKLIEMEDNHEL